MATVTDRWGSTYDEDTIADWAARVAQIRQTRKALRDGLKAKGMSYAVFSLHCRCSASYISAMIGFGTKGDLNDWPIPAYIVRTARELGIEC